MSMNTNRCNNSTSIIRGTTPTIKYTFKQVPVNDIEVCYLTVTMNNKVIIEKDITVADVGNKYIAWKLTQQETLSMTKNRVTFQINWKLSDGTRGASKEVTVSIENNSKEAVI